MSSKDTEWVFSNTESPKDGWVVGTTEVLLIDKVTIDIGGYYFCYGYDETKERHFVSKALLKVHGNLDIISPKINYCVITMIDTTKIYPKARFARIGDATSIVCSMYSPINSSFEGGTIPQNAVPRTNNVLEIVNVKPENQGVYQCQGSTDQGVYYAKSELVAISKSN